MPGGTGTATDTPPTGYEGTPLGAACASLESVHAPTNVSAITVKKLRATENEEELRRRVFKVAPIL